ncbi:ganglioside GM2 activator-like [Branchiostoma lanceolatum]|uniref:ganglioside GM2 activator-like n=1 Tax=Branchiostoma lanceolatum TaxID=7740 RepID=UPI0034562BE2
MSATLKILALLLVAAAAAPPPIEFNDINQLIKALEMPGTFMNDKFNSKPQKVRMSKWRVTDCGMPSDPVKINGTLMPDPLNINDQISGSFNVTSMVMVSSPLKAEVTIMKKVGSTMVKIPCVSNLGSCNYDDLCSLIPLQPGEPCPSPLSDYNIPCMCPFKMGSYVLPAQSFYLPSGILPSWLVTGEYHGKAMLSSNGKSLACRELTMSVVSS